MGTKVFTFQEGITEAGELSSATLTNAPDAPLPDHFIICSSHKQQQIGTRNTETIYALYENSSFTKLSIEPPQHCRERCQPHLPDHRYWSVWFRSNDWHIEAGSATKNIVLNMTCFLSSIRSFSSLLSAASCPSLFSTSIPARLPSSSLATSILLMYSVLRVAVDLSRRSRQ